MKKSWLIFVSFVVISFTSQAQWTQLNSTDLEGCSFTNIINSGSTVLGYSESGGIFRSTDYGKTWSYCGYGLDSSSNGINCHGILGSDIYILNRTKDNSVLYKSTNTGSNWSKVYVKGLPATNYFIEQFGSANNKLFFLVHTFNMIDSMFIYYSSDGVNFSRGAFFGNNSNGNMSVGQINSTKLYFSFSGKLLYTTTGTSFDTIRSTGMNGDFNGLSYSFAAEPSGNYIYYIDNGSAITYDFTAKKWKKIASNIPVTQGVNNIAASKDIVFISAVQFSPTVKLFTYRSLDHGNTFYEMKNTGVDILLMREVNRISDSNLVAYNEIGVLHSSSDTGKTWKNSMTGLYNKHTSAFLSTQNKHFTTQSFYGIIRSDDGGQNWSSKNNGLITPFAGLYFVYDLIEFKSDIYTTIEEDPDGQMRLYKSTNLGDNWTHITTSPTEKRMNFITASSNLMIMCGYDNRDDWWDTTSKYYRSTNGTAWSEISQSFYTTLNLSKVYGMISQGNEIFMFGRTKNGKDGVYYSPNLGTIWNSRWIDNNGVRYLKYFSNNGNIAGYVPSCLIPNTGKLLFTVSSYNTGKQTDSLFIIDGLSLLSVSLTGLPYNLSISHIDYYNGFYYVSTTNGVYASKDLTSWKRATGSNYYLGLTVNKFATSGNVLFVGTKGNGIWSMPHQHVDLGQDIDACYGDSVVLTANSPDKNFSWCCSLGTNKKVTVLPSGNGYYSASATDVFGYTDIDSVKFSMNTKPTPSFSINDTDQCLGNNNFVLTNTSSNAVSYIWNFGDGSTSVATSPSHSYASGTEFYIQLIAITNKNCKDTISKKVTMDIGPDATITLSGDSVICDGDMATLYANTGSNLSYHWLLDGNEISGATLPYFVAKAGGKYTVKVTDTKTGCFSISYPLNLTVNSSDFSMLFSASPRFMTSPPFNVAFDNLTPNASNYTWFWIFGDKTTSTDYNPFHSYLYNGLFSVSLIAKNKTTNCYDTFTRTDYISCSGGSTNPCLINPYLKYTGSLILCKGDSIKLQADTGSGYTYIWTYNGTVINKKVNSFIYASNSGEYRALVTSPACSLMSYPIVLSNYSTSKPVVKSTGQLVPCTNDSMELFVTTYYPSYKWSSGQSSNKIFIKNSGEYRVTVVTAQGCKETSDPFIVNKSLISAPEICLVTVDPTYKKNLIAWERPKSNLIDHYNVYKETFQANVYEFIGSVDYDSVSVFLDTASIPAKRANRYKVTLEDTCKVESSPGTAHTTIHLSVNKGIGTEVNLIWSHYEGFVFSYYKIYRGTSQSNIQLIDSIPSTLNSYTDLNPPSGLLFYQVSVVKKDTCYPAIKRGTVNPGPFSQSSSNIKDYNTIGADYLEVTPKSLNLDSISGSINVDIFTNKLTWTASADQFWITLTPDVNNNLLKVDYLANHNTGPRTATITITASGLPDVTIPVTQNGTSSIKERDQFRITVFPNPAKDYFFVVLPENVKQVSFVDVIDVTGKSALHQIPASGNILKINRGSLSHGIYLVRLTIDNKVYFTKVILNE